MVRRHDAAAEAVETKRESEMLVEVGGRSSSSLYLYDRIE